MKIGNHCGHECWLVTDGSGNAAQARRLDGEKFSIPSIDKTPKAMTLSGSIGCWPIGAAAIQDQHRSILVVEGGPDLLAAHCYITSEGRQHDTAAVSMLGASQRIPEDALAILKGRRVRIFEHADENGAGAAAGLRWFQQLRPYAARVDKFEFQKLRQVDGRKVKDLNDFVNVCEQDLTANPSLAEVIP